MNCNYWNLFQIIFHNNLFITFNRSRWRHWNVPALLPISEHNIEFCSLFKSMLFRLYLYLHSITPEVWKLIRFFFWSDTVKIKLKVLGICTFAFFIYVYDEREPCYWNSLDEKFGNILWVLGWNYIKCSIYLAKLKYE